MLKLAQANSTRSARRKYGLSFFFESNEAVNVGALLVLGFLFVNQCNGFLDG